MTEAVGGDAESLVVATTDAPVSGALVVEADAGARPAGAPRAVVAAVLVAGSNPLAAFLAGAVANQIHEDITIGDAAFGAALSALFAVGGLGAVAAGMRADRMGWPRGIAVAGTASAAALLGVATLATSTPAFVAFMVLAGVGMAFGGPSGALALVRELPPGRQAFAFGVKNAAGPMMSVFAGLSVPAIALTIGWRWAFALAAVVPLAAVVLAPWRRRPPAHQVVRPPRLRDAVTDRPLVIFAVASGLGLAAVTALTSFVVVSNVAAGMGEASAGILVAAGGAFGLVVRISAGWLADRHQTGGFRPATWLLFAGAVGFTCVATGVPALVVPGTLLAYGGGWGWTGLVQYGVVSTHPDAPASAAGLYQVGLAGGGAFGPIGFGVLAEELGYGAAWLAAAGACTGAALLLVVGRRALADQELERNPAARSAQELDALLDQREDARR